MLKMLFLFVTSIFISSCSEVTEAMYQDRNSVDIENEEYKNNNKDSLYCEEVFSYFSELQEDSLSIDRLIRIGATLVSSKVVNGSHTEVQGVMCEYVFNQSKFLFLKFPDKEFLVDCSIRDSNFTFYGRYKVGMTYDKVVNLIRTKECQSFPKDIIILKDEEVDSFLRLIFENETLVSISFEGYLDW